MPMYRSVGLVVLAMVAITQPTPSPSPSPSPSASPNPFAYDLEAYGSTVKAKVGSVVQVDFGLRNLGPGPSQGSGGAMGPKSAITVQLPTGTEVVDHNGGDRMFCQTLQPHAFACFLIPLAAGETLALSARVRVNEARHNATGTVTRGYTPLYSGYEDLDTNRANNIAQIVIDSGETLPQTGPDVTNVVSAGLAAIVAGILLLFALRRNRFRARAARQ